MVKADIDTLQSEMAGKRKSMESLKPMYEMFVGWAKEFDESSIFSVLKNSERVILRPSVIA